MEVFPKKYNYKKSIKTDNKNKDWKKIQSPFIPMDQKINPGIIFSNYYKDLFVRWNALLWENYDIDFWFGLSSQYYSNLSKWKGSTWIDKVISKNKKFLDKLWIDENIWLSNQIGTEEFNIYLRNVFWDIYEKKIFVKKETALWSKDLQMDLHKYNVIKSEKDILEYTIKYFVESKWFAIQVVTTDITTIFWDVAVAVNPIDKRYKKIIWQNVIIPIINRCIPIIADESVEIFKWTWVQRVTPGHDDRSLNIAEKHNLPTDVYAIDTDGTFSEHAWMFAWKPLDEFADNIEKYIDDIGNLTSKSIVKWYEYTNKYTGELLYPITLAQWNISYDYSLDYLHELIDNDTIQIPDDKKNLMLELLDDKKSVNVSYKSWSWLLIPVCYDDKWNGFPLNDKIICSQYLSQKSKKNLIPTLIIFNLICDNKLKNTFSINELLDVLYAKDFLWEWTKMEKYIQIYEEKSKEDSIYKNWLKSFKSIIENFEKNAEKIDELLELLQDSFAISSEWEEFSINYSEIFQYDDTLLLQWNDSFNKSFIDTIWFAYNNNLQFNNGPYSQILSLDQIFISSIDDIHLLLNSLLFGIEYSRTLLFSKTIFHDNMLDARWNKITNFNSKYLSQDLYENLNLYGPDVLRMTILLWDKYTDSKNIIFDSFPMREYNQNLNKIWNANRYIFTKFVSHWVSTKISDLLKSIDKEISDCDIRLLHNIKSFLWDISYQLKNGDYLNVWHNIFNFYKNILCEKYLQSTKVYFSTNTPNIALLAFAILNKLIEPFVPNFSNQIQSKMNFDWEWCSLFNFSDISLTERNYKVNIFMDIIDKLFEIKQTWNIAQHENVDIFVQANSEFLDFIEQNDLLIRTLIKIWEVEYVWDNIETPSWYTTWNVININLWLKKSSRDLSNDKELLNSLMQEFDEKTEYLTHLKWLLASAYSTCPPEILAQKKAKINELQKELDELDYQIWLLKTK